ncbi:MAG TPA: hypothetical protein VGL94_05645 [Ktedonobacteraceae bacterium]
MQRKTNPEQFFAFGKGDSQSDLAEELDSPTRPEIPSTGTSESSEAELESGNSEAARRKAELKKVKQEIAELENKGKREDAKSKKAEYIALKHKISGFMTCVIAQQRCS